MIMKKSQRVFFVQFYLELISNDIFDFLFVISQMVAKGKDASDLFPPVVKNVVSKNLEVNI